MPETRDVDTAPSLRSAIAAEPPTALAGKTSQSRRLARRERSLSVAIASSLFLVLLAAMSAAGGGHAAIGPLLRWVVAERDAHSIGDVMYPMPDGIYCRHLSFDNATGEMSAEGLEHCPQPVEGRRIRPRRFAWGTHQ